MRTWWKSLRHPALATPSTRLSGWRARRLSAHLRRCTECQAAYNRNAVIDRVLEGAPRHVPASSELEFMRRAHLGAALDAARKEKTSPAPKRFLALVPAMALGLAAIVLWQERTPDGSSSAEDAWQARGPSQRSAVLRVFCATPDGALAELTAEANTCSRQGTLAFAASAPTGGADVRLQVSSSASPEPLVRTASLRVTAVRGNEAPLTFTFPLRDVAGAAVTITARFEPIDANEASTDDVVSFSVRVGP